MARTRPVARLRERRLAGSRQEILDATRGVLATTGVLKLTLEAVATELGISKQALYYYFPSRDALLFELGLDELVTSADAVHRAATAAPDGAGALDALIRAYVGHFLPRLELHRLVAMQMAPADVTLTPSQLERIRPINDLLYGEAERKLTADARSKKRDRKAARRLAFTAHLSAMGLLTMRAIADRSNDPLIHSDAELVDELCRTYRAAAADFARTP